MKLIAGQWNELAKRFKTPLLQYEWFSSYADTLGHPKQLRVLVNSSHGEITGIAPLFMTTFSWNRLEILGQRFLSEPMGFIYKDKESLESLIDAISQMRIPLLFWRLGAGSPEVIKLSQLSGWKHFIKSGLGSPFIEVKTDWNTFTKQMTPDALLDLEQKRAQLEKEGKVTIEMVQPSSGGIDNYFEDILRIESTGWKGRARSPLLYYRLKLFYYTYCREMARLGLLRLGFLKIDKKAIAVQIAIEDLKRFWLIKTWRDEAWTSCHPDVVLTHETIWHAHDHNLEGYEFLGHDASWIHRWTRTTHPLVNVRSYPYSFRGMGTFARDASLSVFSRLTGS